MDLNKVMLIGRLTRDVEVRQIPSGQSVATFGLATGRIFKDQSGTRQERTEYHNIVAWGRLAEICKQYLVKGKQVYIEGRLQTHDWEGQDGVKRYRTEIIAENMIMLGSRSDGGAPFTSGASSSAPTPDTSGGAGDLSQPFPPNEEEIQLENIPF